MTNNNAAREAQDLRSTPSEKSARQFTADLFAWLDQVALDRDLPSSAFKVAYVIGEHINRVSGEAWPASRTIAKACALSQPTVIELVPKLVANGHLALEPGRAGRGHSHRYQMVLKDRRADHSRPIKDRAADHFGEAKRSVSPAEKIGQPITKDQPADQNLLLNHLEPLRGGASPRRLVDGVSVTESKTAGDDRVDPALEISEPKRETPEGARLDRNCLDRDQNRTAPLKAPYYIIGRPDEIGIVVNQKGTVMAQKNETLETKLFKLKNAYPKFARGTDDENTIAALELALDHGISLVDLIYKAMVLSDAAHNDGADVPQLVEFLVNQCITETPLHALH
jgi:hypothetical protein